MSVVAYSIGKATRGDEMTKQSKNIPGPGNYEPKATRYNTSPQWGMGTSKRPAINRVSNNPGPQ